MHVALLSLDDLADLQRLESLCFYQDAWSEKQLISQLKHPRMFNLGCWQNNQLIGFALLSPVLDEAELLQIGVSPEHRNQGVAAQLMALVIEQLKGQQVTRIMLEVRAGNEAAIKLYESLGFALDGERKNYYAPLFAQTDNEESHQAFNKNQRENALLFSLEC